QKLSGSRDPTEEKFYHQDRCVMVAPWCILPNRLAGTICEQDTVIVPKSCVPDRRLDAHARGAPGENEVLDARILENRVQLSLIEAAESMLVDDDIGRLRHEAVENVRAPGVTNQHAPFSTIRRLDRLSDSKHL